MANYDKKRFYWLQLKEDFFEDDAISWLEEQENGKDYVLFYLKLCLKSLKSDGVLYRTVGSMLIPYDAKKLAELTKTNIDTVINALKLLNSIGLISIYDNGAIFMEQISGMVGSQSIGAFKKQQQRRVTSEKIPKIAEGGQGVDKCPPKLELELEKELENKDKVKELYILPGANSSEQEEPPADNSEEPSTDNTVITLLLNDNSEYPISESTVKEFEELYPAVDIMQELRNMKGWLKNNPKRRKTKSGIMRFVNSWLAKEQNKGGNSNDGAHRGSTQESTTTSNERQLGTYI